MYSSLEKYGEAKCGKGVIAPPFCAYRFGTVFNKNTKPVILFSNSVATPAAKLSEFDRMLRQKK